MDELPLPQEPPRLKTGKLWLSLLSPTGTVIILLIITAVFPPDSEAIFMIMFLTVALVSVLCWAWFGSLIEERFRGPSAKLIIFSYPIAQLIVCGTVFFFGCLATFGY